MIRQAEQKDLGQINELLTRSRLNIMTLAQISDECLVGEIDGKIRGVIWAGVTRSGWLAVVDYFAVDPGFKGLGFRLARSGLRRLHEIGVEKVLTFVENMQDREVSMRINEWFGLKREQSIYFLLTGEPKEMVKQWDKARPPRKSRS